MPARPWDRGHVSGRVLQTDGASTLRADRSAHRSRLIERPVRWAVFLVTVLALEALGKLQLVLSARAFAVPMDVAALLRTHLLALLLLLLLYVPIAVFVERVMPATRVGLARHLLLLLAALVPIVWIITVASPWLDRTLLGSGLVVRGSTLARAIGMYPVFATALVASTLADLQMRLREQGKAAAQLEARLAEARLAALSSQLQPHFLFNTLTAISTLMHRDVNAADTMLTRLSELLRATLQQPMGAEIQLGEELSLLERYVDIMTVRYGERLRIEFEIHPDVRELLVPTFILQPLVENALEHGVAERAGPARVRIAAQRMHDRLQLSVTDDGPGYDASAMNDAAGIGLTNTRRRLQELYGSNQRLVLEPVLPMGTRAIVELPAGLVSRHQTRRP